MAQFQRGLKHSGAWENPRHGDANHVGKPDISAAFTGRPRARDTYKEGGRKRDGETNRGKYRDRKREREREREREKAKRKGQGAKREGTLVADPDSTSNAAQCIACTCSQRVRSVHGEKQGNS